jgi:hypothetical protein
VWFSEYADEVARLLVEARGCADACEARVAAGLERPDADALIAAAAVCRILDDLVEQEPSLFVGAVRVCRELTTTAAAYAPDEPSLVRAAQAASDFLEATR